jgi:hypothetical protein
MTEYRYMQYVVTGDERIDEILTEVCRDEGWRVNTMQFPYPGVHTFRVLLEREITTAAPRTPTRAAPARKAG